MAANEDDGGTKTATNGTLLDRTLCNPLVRRWSGHLCFVSSLLRKVDSKGIYNINTSVHNA